MKHINGACPPAPATPPVKPLPPPTREQIAALAHAIWLDRGSPRGSDLDIWLEAERQLTDNAPPHKPMAADSIPADPAHPGAADDPAVTSRFQRRSGPPLGASPRSPTTL